VRKAADKKAKDDAKKGVVEGETLRPAAETGRIEYNVGEDSGAAE
jgi:hypothetical protein